MRLQSTCTFVCTACILNTTPQKLKMKCRLKQIKRRDGDFQGDHVFCIGHPAVIGKRVKLPVGPFSHRHLPHLHIHSLHFRRLHSTEVGAFSRRVNTLREVMASKTFCKFHYFPEGQKKMSCKTFSEQIISVCRSCAGETNSLSAKECSPCQVH